jgi:hypothetical protein
MVNTLDSAKVPEGPGSTSTVVDSLTLVKTGKKHTTPDAGQALEILASVIRTCQDAGIVVQTLPLYDQGHTSTAIVLVDVKIIDGRLVALNP